MEVSCSDLFILSRPPIALSSLACVVDLSKPSARLLLGASLQSLTLQLPDESTTASIINDAIVTISRLPVLESLQLHLRSFSPEVSFAPFAGTPRLKELCCETGCLGELSHAQLDQLRMLPRLRTMSVRGDDLEYLLRAPHSLQWQRIHRVRSLDDDTAAALSTLPTLTELATDRCRSVAFLPALTCLRSLQLGMDPDVDVAEGIALGLPYCTQLTDLSLRGAHDVTSRHLSQALSHLPALRVLSLMCCSALESLSFLSECSHLAHSLRSLKLYGSKRVPSTELTHVLTLKSLTHLTICEFFVDPLDATTQTETTVVARAAEAQEI